MLGTVPQVIHICTCFPSIAPLISLNVEVNSPMKSCLPLESQSHTMHCKRKELCLTFIYLLIYLGGEKRQREEERTRISQLIPEMPMMAELS